MCTLTLRTLYRRWQRYVLRLNERFLNGHAASNCRRTLLESTLLVRLQMPSLSAPGREEDVER